MGSVDDALAALPEPARAEGSRQAPHRIHGERRHLSVFPFSAAVVDAVAPRLEGFSVSKGTIRFTADHPVPTKILTEIVRLRLREIT